ncbi:hypothetical protein TRVL_08376 [Trypanosoma vivax]|nr:hypothetical protein TRVL_08376 [Trypanosoma vivax]
MFSVFYFPFICSFTSALRRTPPPSHLKTRQAPAQFFVLPLKCATAVPYISYGDGDAFSVAVNCLIVTVASMQCACTAGGSPVCLWLVSSSTQYAFVVVHAVSKDTLPSIKVTNKK